MTSRFLLQAAGVVQRLEDDARGQRAVADDRDRVAVGVAQQVVADLQAQRRVETLQPAWPVMNRS